MLNDEIKKKNHYESTRVTRQTCGLDHEIRITS